MTDEELFYALQAEGDPLTPKDWTWADALKERAHRELVRQCCVEEYSQSQLWQARAAKDPHYWDTFYVGRYNLPDGWKPKQAPDKSSS